MPVISTNVGSIHEIIGPESGFIVKPGDLNEIKKAIEKLSNSEKLRGKMAKFNLEYAASNFTHERVFDEIGKVYEILLSD